MGNMAKLKKIATFFGLFVITFLTGFAAANTSNKNDGVVIAEAAGPSTTTVTAGRVQPAVVETFTYDCINETIVSEGKTLPVKEVERTLNEKEGIAKFAAKAQIGEKTVLLSGEIPTTVLEPIICEFQNKSGTQTMKLPKGFITATIA